MKSDLSEWLIKYAAIFENRDCEVYPNDYERFETNKRLLSRIAEVENSSLTVFDIAKKHYLLICSRFDCLIHNNQLIDGVLIPEKLFELMHPEDVPFVIDTLTRSFNFLDELPSSEKVDYKLIFDFRLVNTIGVYVRFIQQTVVLELDKNGNIWLILKLIDLVPGNNYEETSQRKMLNMKTGQLCLFNDHFENNSKNILTKRETEILGLIYQGLDSAAISGKLFISFNTVNNHRQNILNKTKMKNITQVLLYAKKIGII